MFLFEHDAKTLLAAFGIAAPDGVWIDRGEPGPMHAADPHAD